MVNVDIVFYQAIKHIRSKTQVLLVFCYQSSVVSVSGVSKSLQCVQICPECVPSSVLSGIGVILYLVDHFSKSLVCCLGSDTCIHSLEVSSKIYTQLYWITFFFSLHSIITSTGLSFPQVLHVSHNFSIILRLHQSSSTERIKREKKFNGNSSQGLGT